MNGPRRYPVPREYRISWIGEDNRWVHVYGDTPGRAIVNCRRVRRDYWLCGKSLHWLPSTREQLRWMRLAKRIGRSGLAALQEETP